MKLQLMPDFLSVQDKTCLSIYLPRVKGSDLSSNKSYLKHIRTEVYELLRWSHERELYTQFLNAIERIQEQSDLVKNKKYNLAIFVTDEGQWDFRFSGECKPFFSLANSFHIKPMLRYFHRNRKFFVLRFGNDRTTLYVDGPERLKALDSIIYPSALKDAMENFDLALGPTRRAHREQLEDFSAWISDWVSQDLVNEDAPLIVVGVGSLVKPFIKNAAYKGTMREDLGFGLSYDETELFKSSKKVVKQIAEKEEKKAVSSFNRKLLSGLGSTSLTQIAKQAIQDNVSLLMVAKDDHIWGELNRITGDVQVHHEQLSDLDDDLLDDLAEVVLGYKGNVLVLDRAHMPGTEPIAAVLKRQPANLSLYQSVGEPTRTLQQERDRAIAI